MKPLRGRIPFDSVKAGMQEDSQMDHVLMDSGAEMR